MAVSVSVADDQNDHVLFVRSKSLSGCTNVAFAPNNDFVIHQFDNKSRVVSQQSNTLHIVKRGSSLHNRFTRKLVNECHGIFLSAVRLPDNLDDNARSQSIKKLSQRYHSVLLACLEDLEEAKGSSEKIEGFEIMEEMLCEIELIWSLVEVLLFDMQSSSLVLYRLLDWIQWHFTDPAKKTQAILNEEEPYQHESYWDTILQYVLQGNISAARSLLKVHKLRSREDFLSLDELLRKMPLNTADSAMSWNEFQMRWHHWQEECRRRTSEQEFAAVDGLNTLAKILCGDTDTLDSTSNLCCTWYHFLISYLLYTDPAASVNILGAQARTFVGIINPEAQLTEMDNIILAAFELDLMTLIKNCCSYFNDSWWFVAHMNDLLFRGDYISGEIISHPRCLRESLLLNYAESLMTHKSLWEVGVDYLDQCEEYGREYLELYLQSIPLETEAKARKIVFIAKERNLDDLVKSICKVMAVRAMRKEMLGTALSWVIKSKDVRLATDFANRWMKEYLETGKLQCLEILKNLGLCMLVSDKLTFLGKYCEFHKLSQEKEHREAASLLISLLSSGLVPKQFQMILLLDALPLLEAPMSIFTMKDTTVLMTCLEKLNNTTDEKGVRKKEGLIRLALARNVARSFIAENRI